MNQDNNQTTSLLLKVILATQILMLILFACSYIANSSQRTEYTKEMEQYRAKEAEYEKGMEEYQKQMDDYKIRLAEWEKANAGQTNSAAQPPQ